MIRQFTAWRVYVRKLKEDKAAADKLQHDALVKAKVKEIKSLTQAKTKIQIQFNDQIQDLQDRVKHLENEILARGNILFKYKLEIIL